jgi:putative transcriptional regulator
MIKIKLLDLMEKNRIKIADLAEKTGLHRNGISKIVNQKTKGIEYKTLDILCKTFNCKVEDIIEYIPDDENKSDQN